MICWLMGHLKHSGIGGSVICRAGSLLKDLPKPTDEHASDGLKSGEWVPKPNDDAPLEKLVLSEVACERKTSEPPGVNSDP
mmetsp:Transcript_111426/g.320105  ORF Transcript_111426/g.320105 Transcript_111426/m.320105 type:complete len:81 (+) Transcript_111426:649-891(+)